MFIRYRAGVQGCSPGERMTVGHAGVRGLHAVLSEHSRSDLSGISPSKEGVSHSIRITLWTSRGEPAQAGLLGEQRRLAVEELGIAPSSG